MRRSTDSFTALLAHKHLMSVSNVFIVRHGFTWPVELGVCGGSKDKIARQCGGRLRGAVQGLHNVDERASAATRFVIGVAERFVVRGPGACIGRVEDRLLEKVLSRRPAPPRYSWRYS